MFFKSALPLLGVAVGFVLEPRKLRSSSRRLWATSERGMVEDGLAAVTDGAKLVARLASLPATAASVDELTAEIQGAAGPSSETWLKEQRRYLLLAGMLQSDPELYTAVATRLLDQGIDRLDLPNEQRLRGVITVSDDTVADCDLPNTTFVENFVEAWLLDKTRRRYAVHSPTGAFRSSEPGISGLLAEMRVLMLTNGTTSETEKTVVYKVLLDLMTPVLPPFYRIFMAGLVPSIERGDPEWLVDAFARLRSLVSKVNVEFADDRLAPGKRIFSKELPYAPLLTSLVAPFAFGFLVGPARVNLRDDGQLGGLVVEKCKFLQESGCKGLCLNQCKLPAQQLFEDLGVPLHVSPNFETQECQWSFGVVAPVPELDPAWPRGCLVGCPSRTSVNKPASS